MTEWTLLKRLLDAVHQHSTMIGRLWLTVMVIFRLLVVAVAAEDVYADEQEMFVCNTLQPGCATVCYDAFAPISQPRFWVFHIISVSTPSLCFIIYTWHSLSKLPHGAGPGAMARAGARPRGDHVPREAAGRDGARDGGQEAYDRSCDSDSCSVRSHKHLGHSVADVLEGLLGQDLQKADLGKLGSSRAPGSQADACREANAAETPRVSGGVLSKCYVFHVCVRAVLEVGFVSAQWMLFGFRVPVNFLCRSAPCMQPVDCYVSRPTEKTIFLLFMFCVGLFCILLNLLELNHLGWKKIRRTAKVRETRPARRQGYTALPPGSPSLTSTVGFRDVTSTASLPTLDLVVGHLPDWTCAGNCTLFREAGGGTEGELRLPGRPEGVKKERRPLRAKGENRGARQHSAEVWI